VSKKLPNTESVPYTAAVQETVAMIEPPEAGADAMAEPAPEPPPAPAIILPQSNSREARLRRVFHKVAFWCAILCVASFALVAGLIVRRWIWDQTEPIRFRSDINNCFLQGSLTLREGYLDRYDKVFAQHQTDDEYEFDYAPARLGIATLWARYVRTRVGGPGQDWSQITDDWRPERFYNRAQSIAMAYDGSPLTVYDLMRPLLIINTIGEIISAIAVFFLVRRWTSGRGDRRSDLTDSTGKSGPKPAILGLIAVLFFWFNLALIWNAHAWPQWDSWVLPFFLWAVVAASADWWFAAGMLITVGAMFKGQILFGAPFFLLWPLFRGRPLAIVQWIIGAATGVALCTGVWLLRKDQQFNPVAIRWVIMMAAAFAVLVLALRPRWREQWMRLVALGLSAVALGFILWHFISLGGTWVVVAAIGAGTIGAIAAWAPWRGIAYAGVGWVASSVLLCAVLFGGSMAWFHIGIEYGTHRYLELTRGPDNNLAGILEDWHGPDGPWRDPMESAMTISAGPTANWLGSTLSSLDKRVNFTKDQPFDVPLKYLLVAIYTTAVVLCSIGAAIHSRRGSPRFLVAVAAPWIVFFAVMTQMHERYLLWGAALSALTVALGPGWALLHLLLSVVAWSQEAPQMVRNLAGSLRPWERNVYDMIAGWHPGIGWAVMLTAAIFLYVAIAPQRKARRALRS
jgi:hypothetical protein